MVGRRGLELTSEHNLILRRIQGVLTAQNYLMIDYNIARSELEEASAVTPGLSGPTVSPLSRDDMVAVRALVPRKGVNAVMDQLDELGAEAILASELRIARI